jgi:beta-lactamase family protein
MVRGTYDPRFADLVKALEYEFVNGDEVGAALAVDVDGDRSAEWAEDTIVNVWSSTKPVCVLAALMLVDRGLLDLDAPVARYWPEFAANGKQDVLVRHVLSPQQCRVLAAPTLARLRDHQPDSALCDAAHRRTAGRIVGFAELTRIAREHSIEILGPPPSLEDALRPPSHT